MRYLIITDIYANLEAFETVLNDAKDLYDKVWCLGDLVAFGPYPNDCVDLLLTLDHVCVAGDGDWIALGKSNPDLWTIDNLDDLNENRKYAYLLTREKLTDKTRNYLDSLPISLVKNNCTLVHASPRHPLLEDVLFPTVAKPNFNHFQSKYCFHGHTNVPAIYQEPAKPDKECGILVPYSETSSARYGEPFQLGQQRLMMNPGGVGGSDIRHLAFDTSFYGIFDDEKQTFEFRKISLRYNAFSDLWKRIKEAYPNKFEAAKSFKKQPTEITKDLPKSQKTQKTEPFVDARLSLPDFPTPFLDAVTRTDKADLQVGYPPSPEKFTPKARKHYSDSYDIVHFQSPTQDFSTATLAVVARGFGMESQYRKVASEIAVAAIVERFSQGNANVKDLYIEGFAAAAQEIAQFINAKTKPRYETAVTCAGVFILNRCLYLASLGDCQVFLLRQRELKPISIPHTFPEHLIERGVIGPDEAPIRWNGTRFLNWLDEEDSYPDFRLRLSFQETKKQSAFNQGLKLQAGDQILIFGGLYWLSYFKPTDLEGYANLLSRYSNPQKTVNYLVSELWKDGNPTIILLKVP